MVLQGTEGKLGTIDVAMYGPHEPGRPHSCRHENGFLKGRTVSTENSVQLFHPNVTLLHFICLANLPCAWRIVNSHMIPRDSRSCYDSAMRNLVVLFIHFIATRARLLGPGGVRALVA
jgi:hypothetical protein